MLKVYKVNIKVKINKDIFEFSNFEIHNAETVNKDKIEVKKNNLYDGLKYLKENCSLLNDRILKCKTLFKKRPYLQFTPYINSSKMFIAYKDKVKKVDFVYTIEIEEFKRWTISMIIKEFSGEKATQFLIERGLNYIKKD